MFGFSWYETQVNDRRLDLHILILDNALVLIDTQHDVSLVLLLGFCKVLEVLAALDTLRRQLLLNFFA